MKRASRLIAMLLSAALAASPAAAQYPSKPVRLVVPFPAGGATDAAARTVGQALSRSLGQPIVVENKPGADGTIAAQAVAAAPADGHTLLFAVASMMALPYLTKPAPFEAGQFAPVSTVGRFAFGLYVHPSVPANSVQEFVAYARANPGRLNFASATMSEYLAAAQFMKATGIEMTRIPYKGGAQAIPDLVAGRVHVYFTPVGPLALGHVKEGRLRLLATLTHERLAVVPDVPTLAQAGVQGVSVPTQQMVLAPAATPGSIVDRLAREIGAALQDASVRSELDKQSLIVEASTPSQLGETIREISREWASFVREHHLAEP
ncbi:MAG TPA: tripartite tricarboxylate transporter substrate binding protein [Usitatibacter sp.]|nr:tripartite tricarboxylate transporter substrate binding protein [Usitatibacter sp.]